MTYVLLPDRVHTPPMRADCDDYHRLGWTRQPGDGGVLHIEVIGKSTSPVPEALRSSAQPPSVDKLPSLFLPTSNNSVIRLRDYQRDCIEAVGAAWDRGVVSPLIVCPTGAGKTVIAASIMDSAFVGRGHRSLFVAHRRELIAQTADKIRLVAWTGEGRSTVPRIGTVQSKTNEVGRDITIASVQTIGTPRNRRLQEVIDSGPLKILICDEAHHAVSPQWRRVINTLREAFPDLVTLGMTATPGRSDGTALDSVFSEIVFEKNLLDMIAAGYLVPPKGYKVALGLNLDTVSTSGGDFVQRQLGKLMNQPVVNRAVVEAWCRYGHNRKTLVFAVDVAHAIALRDEFKDAGYDAEHVDGKMKTRDRNGVISRFRDGTTKILVQCEIATEGFDEPSIECILFARPTQSQTLYIQGLGRGLRLYPSKTECLVIDCVGNGDRHRPVQLASLVGFDPQRSLAGGGGNGEGEDDAGLTPHVIGSEVSAEEVDLTSRRATTRYQWRETSLGWVLQIPRIGYYLVAWTPKSRTRCTIRFYDQRPGRRDTPPVEVVKNPVDFDLAYGLVESEMDRIFLARTGRSAFGDNRNREFHTTDHEEMSEINFVDLDEGVDDQLEVPELFILKGAVWRDNKVSDKQLDLLRKLGVKEKSLPEKAGEASDLITILRIERDAKMRLPATPKQLAYLRVNELPTGPDMTKGKAAGIIWRHRKATGF